MKTSLKLGLFATSVVVLSLVLATGSPAQSTSNLGDESLTIREQLEKWDGAQAFLAIVEVASQRCPRFSRLLDRKRADIVALVPTNAAIADYLRIDPTTFDGLDVPEIATNWSAITTGRDVEPRALCRLLRKHFSKSKAKTIKELLDRGFITTVNGEEIPVSIGQGGVNFDGKGPVTVREVVTLNGVIHFLGETLAQEPAQPSSGVVQVFISSSQTYPNRFFTDGVDTFDGLEGADLRCQDLAQGAGLAGTWTAWLSTTDDPNTDEIEDDINAIDRIPDGRYELVNGELVAEDKADLIDGFLETNIELDENGRSKPGLVWTGTNRDGTATNQDGTAADNCENWTTNDALVSALHGASSERNRQWTEIVVTNCDQGGLRLYCFGSRE